MTATPLRLAHRGDWRRAPENSIDAFAAAMAVPGCDGVELDVRLAGDGTPVVIHDATLERVQGRPGTVAELPAGELAAAGVPSLADALGSLPAWAFVYVELKVDGGPTMVDVVADARGPGLDGAIVASFDPDAIETVRRQRPGWPCWLNADVLDAAAVRRAMDLGCAAVAAHWQTINPRSIAVARAAGLEVGAWTVRRISTYRRLARLGVSAVCVEAAALDGDGNGPDGDHVEVAA